MRVVNIVIGTFAFVVALLAVSCVFVAPEVSADPITQSEGGVIYSLEEGGGSYYATVTGYDGTSNNVVIKSVVTYEGIDYTVNNVNVDIFNVVNSTPSADKEAKSNIQTVVIEANPNLSLTASMFSELPNLTSVSIGEGIKEIPTNFCYKCLKLVEVNMPSTIKTIGAYAFSYCPLLASVELGEAVEKIMDDAFIGCKSITSVVIPDSVTTIGDRVFKECSALSAVTMGANMTKTGKNTFESTIITSIFIPAKCATVSSSAFPETCESITIEEGHTKYYSDDGVVYRKTALGSTPADAVYIFPKGKTGTLTVNHEVIAAAAFANLKQITKIVILENVKRIDERAFAGCTSVEEITMTNSVESIGLMAFYRCESLKSITLSKNVKSLENSTFNGCSKLESIDLSSITSIGSTCFQDCTALSLTSLPDSIESIGDLAFNRCSNVSISKLPAKLSSIGELAFANTGIVDLTLGDGEGPLTITTTDAVYPIFSGQNLRSVKIDNAKTALNDAKLIIGFADSPNLKKVEITDKFDGLSVLGGDKGLFSRMTEAYPSKVVLQSVYSAGSSYELMDKNQVPLLEDPISPTDSVFVGWFIDSDCTVGYDSSKPLTESTVIYAKYKFDKVTVNLLVDGIVEDSFKGLRGGDVITLKSEKVADKIFDGWLINGLLLGAQYIVSTDDADESGIITLTASFSDPVPVASEWALTVTGEGIDGKVFWTKSNSIGNYGMITVLPDEFEKASFEVSENGGYGIISDTCAMVYSNDGKDVSVTVKFSDVGKASDYTVSLVEIVKDNAPGFRATVSADDGYVDTDGTFSIRYIYKVYDEENQVWAFTTSGQTTGVEDAVIALGTEKASKITGEFVLDVDGAYLVYGYASYSFKDESAGATVTEVVTSPVIMSVSEIQAVTKP